MVSLHENVDMIGHDFNVLKQPIIDAARFGNDALQLNCQRVIQDRMSVFGTPDDMVSK